MERFYRKLIANLLFLLLIPLFAFSFFSCSAINADSSSSSVSFTFTGEFVRKIQNGTSRSLSSSELENLYVEISLSGSYTATKTAAFSAGTTVIFQEIPVDSKIYAKAEIYRLEDAEKTILYEGESEKITVKDGENTLSLKMKKATPIATGITALPTESGTYYLTQDITISSTWTVPSGETVLDLNGYGILMTGGGSVIKVSSGAEFTLTDSGATTHYFDLSSATTEHGAVTDAYATNITTSSGTQSFTGGYISGGTGTTGSGIYVNGGTFNMYGGTIIGNHVDYSGGSGGGVHVCNGGNFTLYDGTISYNFVQNVCGGVFVTGGTFTMLGGSVSLNKSAWGMGSGIAIRASSTFKLYGGRVEYNEGAINSVPCVDFDGDGITLYLHGNPLVLNNTTTDGTKNIYLREEDNRPTIIIDGELTGNEKTIGMSMKNAGVFTNSTNTSYNDESKFVSDDESYIVSQNSGGQLELTSKPVTLATALKEGAEIVCAYSETKWDETSQVSCSFKNENGVYTNTTTSGYTDATLTFDETENTLTVVFTEDVYIDTTIFYISSSQYKYERVIDETNPYTTSGSKMSFSSITINGEDITNTLTQN